MGECRWNICVHHGAQQIHMCIITYQIFLSINKTSTITFFVWSKNELFSNPRENSRKRVRWTQWWLIIHGSNLELHVNGKAEEIVIKLSQSFNIPDFVSNFRNFIQYLIPFFNSISPSLFGYFSILFIVLSICNMLLLFHTLNCLTRCSFSTYALHLFINSALAAWENEVTFARDALDGSDHQNESLQDDCSKFSCSISCGWQ